MECSANVLSIFVLILIILCKVITINSFCQNRTQNKLPGTAELLKGKAKIWIQVVSFTGQELEILLFCRLPHSLFFIILIDPMLVLLSTLFTELDSW